MFEGSRTQFEHTHERLSQSGDIKSRSGEISVRCGSGRKKGLYQLPISIDMSIEVHKTLLHTAYMYSYHGDRALHHAVTHLSLSICGIGKRHFRVLSLHHYCHHAKSPYEVPCLVAPFDFREAFLTVLKIECRGRALSSDTR